MLFRSDSLKYTSVIALISIGYLVILVVYHFATGDTLPERGDISVVQPKSIVSILASFPVIVFAYTCHQNMLSILNEIADNSHFRKLIVRASSLKSGSSLLILIQIRPSHLGRSMRTRTWKRRKGKRNLRAETRLLTTRTIATEIM